MQRFSEFVQTEPRVQKSSAALGRNAAEFAANCQRTCPLFFAHEMMETELKDLRARLECVIERVQLGDRLGRHPEFGITAGCPKTSFEIHE